jgi:hypothetical protein
MPALYGGETHMLMVAKIVIDDRFCTSPAYVLCAEYWVVDWAQATSLTGSPRKNYISVLGGDLKIN